MAEPRITRDVFGSLPDGREVERVTLHGAGGFEARIITFGAALQALLVPDAHGAVDDVVLGHDDLLSYVKLRKFFGATVGRYANRIAGARFTLDGDDVRLEANDGAHALHGGPDGFDRKLWQIVATEDGEQPSVTLLYVSPDGEANYPGRLDVRVTYQLTGRMELSVTFAARTTRTTIINLTNHSFFNLDGLAAGTGILDHRLTLAADHYLAIDETAIPLPGPPHDVAGTPFDFRDAQPIGARIRADDAQIKCGRGYDHNFCLRAGDGLRLAARLESPRSGRVMELHTDQPGLQVYSGNYIDATVSGKGRVFRQSDALCLEPQVWPDTPNRPDFPSARLAPDEVYKHETIYRFSTTGASA
ncbi:Aldose 1-epimerase (Galactose mutarotase) [Bradyrhizobium sp. ORS 285]|uniref:aldose epimerase family protein n=1 Tax=Bradyrhizobium sp. ORS 285 TaxID=115808 RepID=UPI000240674F|nr:aldose epimerase family protein [Bradyrhizobium sp. ORS 285]CCD85459.1 Aldose 1-epimerase (Galactose mutarotase) [Bradyrhizobium sp. ORS 285]SMX60274.1 Aldose 1-epimerase (Galactose mutarotase) [Bradyrhizobium sp. ORS 285]